MGLFEITVVAALLVGGLGVALLGSIKVPLAARLAIDEARVGGLVSLFPFTMIPVILTAGFLTDLAGRDVVFIAGSAVLSASVVLLGLAWRYPIALAAVVLFSAGWSLLINVTNVLTPLAFPGADASDTARATNLGNVFFGIGAFLTPLAVPWLVRRFSLPAGLGMVALIALLPALLALRVDFAAAQPAASSGPTQTVDAGQLLSDPMLWLCGLGLFFYGPLEASLAAWATTYLGEHGVERGAAGLLSGFWLAYMASRLLTAFTLPAGYGAVLILTLGLVAAALLLTMVLTRSRSLAMVLVPAVGFVFGPVFPTLLALLFSHFPPQVHGRAVGLFFAIGGVGWTLLPIMIGAYATRHGVRRALVLAVLFSLGLSVIAGLLISASRR